MNISLTWDLFIVVFISLIMAYSFIIGRRQTMKVIISTYIAFLAADGLGYFFQNTITYSLPERALDLNPAQLSVFTSIVLFVTFIVVLSRHHSFDVNIEDSGSDFPYLLTTGMVSFLSAVLIVVSILFFLSGNSLADVTEQIAWSRIVSLADQSEIARSLVDYFYVSFFLPAISLVAVSIFDKKAGPGL